MDQKKPTLDYAINEPPLPRRLVGKPHSGHRLALARKSYPHRTQSPRSIFQRAVCLRRQRISHSVGSAAETEKTSQ